MDTQAYVRLFTNIHRTEKQYNTGIFPAGCSRCTYPTTGRCQQCNAPLCFLCQSQEPHSEKLGACENGVVSARLSHKLT